MIILNSPQNSTGGVLNSDDLEEIAKIVISNDIWVMSGEIYSRIIYDRSFNSIISIKGMPERTVLIDWFSKIYSMTGWRLGYGIVPKELTPQWYPWIQILSHVQQLLHNKQVLKRMKAARKIQRKWLKSSGTGAFYVFTNVIKACANLGLNDSRELQQKIFHEGNVAVFPKTSFGLINPGEKEEYIRLSYATSRENIIEGLKRIKSLIEK